MKKKKIAICFFGQMRLFEALNDHFSKWNNASTEFEYDFFISSWDDFDTDRITLPLKGKLFWNEEKVTKNWQTGHTQKFSFHLNSVLKLKQRYEKENNFGYYKVMSLRPDILVDLIQFEKVIHTLKDKTNMVSVAEAPRLEEGYLRLDTDYTFIYDTDTANLHSNMYSWFYLSKNFRSSDFPYREGGHWIHPFFFRHYNIEMASNEIKAFLIRPTRDINLFEPGVNTKDLITKLGNKCKDWTLEDDLITSGSAVREFKGRLL